MTSDRSNAMTLGALGMLSGAVASGLIILMDVVGSWFGSPRFQGDFKIFAFGFLPGLVFGLIIGLLLHRRGKVVGPRLVGYVAAAGVAYFCAFFVAQYVEITFFPTEPELYLSVVDLAICGIAGGLVSSLLLGLMTMFLLRVPGRLVLRLPVLIGGAAGALLGLAGDSINGLGWYFPAFFVLWQGAYAASLAPLLRPAA